MASSDWVQPALPLKPQSVLLAPFEQYAPRWWMINVLCFPLSASSSSPQQIVSQLQAGLSRTMVEFPLLVGRVDNTPEADGKILIRVPDKPAAGVELSQTEHPSPTYAQLKARHFCTSSLTTAFGSDLLSVPEVIHGSVVFRARATFIPGGLLLTLGVSHAIADGEGFAVIQRAWARNTREASSAEHRGVLFNPLAFDQSRARLWKSNETGTLCRSSPYIFVDKHNINSSDTPPKAAPLTLQKLPTKETSPYVQPPFTSKHGMRCIWYFSPEKLQELKALASPCSEEDPIRWISTFDALTAFLWQRTAFVRQLSGQGFMHAKCFVSMNIRPRLQPPLHPEFLGNAADLSLVQHPSAELENEQTSDLATFHKALPKLARQIRAGIQGCNTAHYESLIRIITSLPSEKTLSMDTLPGDEPGLLLTDTSKTGTYATDWGTGLQCPQTSRFLMSDPGIPLNIFLVLPQLPNGGLELLAFFRQEVMDKLAEDKVFCRFAEFRGD
ncbi:hypothetical protein BO71DRAFT_463990 [Aspergillus ellipticus CBS 707.79]|uniref:Transferase family protein n=1 Tax=Aspergillus ellipticus CBS 707.79 TaxID=1448320 RepID=A0A319DKI8_9EURO|nr:hypothetical protein BO71DRAFT_463990 [Aspergillus ellipticus CBS 707.79]